MRLMRLMRLMGLMSLGMARRMQWLPVSPHSINLVHSGPL